MNELQIVKKTKFNGIPCDFYKDSKDEIVMTISQLAECLGYADRKSIEKILERNSYLKSKEFSVTDKLSATDGKTYNTRLFNEDGIYEITMLSKTEKAKEFRAFVRKTLKALRKGEAKLVSMTDYQRMMAQSRIENAKIRKANILTKLAEQYDGTYRQVLNSYATKELTGEHILPLPELKEKVYTAKEVGEKLGISANKVGILTNRYGLKNDHYGKWFHDKAKGYNKEVSSFRYYETIIPKLESIINNS